MRLALFASLLVHAGAVAAAWLCLLPPPARKEDGTSMLVLASLEVPPLPDAEPPPPQEPAPPPAAVEPFLVEELIDDPAPDFPDELVDLEEELLIAKNPALAIPPRIVRLRTPLRRPGAAPPKTVDLEPKADSELPIKPLDVPRRRARPGKVTPPRIVREKSPLVRYPARARRMGLSGRVVVLVRVSPLGSVDSVEVVRSSGHAELDRAAAASVRRWVFVPGRRDGKPVTASVRIPIVFALRE